MFNGLFGAVVDAVAPPPVVIAPPSWKTRARRWALRKAGRLVRKVMRKLWGKTRLLAPWYIALTVWVAAALVGMSEQGWRTLAAISVAGVVPMYWWLGGPFGRWSRRRKLKPIEHRLWYAGFYALLALWAPVAAAWTVLPPWAGALWLPTLAVWIRWMWHHRARKEPSADVALGRHEEIWADVKGMKGTRLINPVECADPPRLEAEVDLSDTDLLVKDVVAAIPHIAKKFRVPVPNVIADHGPTRLEHVAKLTVVTDNPCNDPIEYDESWIPTEQDIAEGCVPFHMYPNGTRARVRLWLPGAGTVNSLFSGDIRTGKSAGMETKLLQATWTGKVWPMAADPQGGISMPWWCKPDGSGLAKWQATDDDGIWDQLCAFREAMYDRSAAMAEFEWTDKWGDRHIGINCWDPSIPGMPPAVGWSCDEFWRLMLNDAYFEVFKECMKMQNKTGMFMDIATQYPGIEEFHNDMAMRQPLTAGNLLSYRNTASSVKEMILPKSLPSPLDIPWETPDGQHTKGTLICASQAPRSSLPVYSRTVWAERGRYWGERAMERVPELDAVTRQAFDRAIKQNREQREKLRRAAGQPAERERIEVQAAAPKTKVRAEDRILTYLSECDDGRAHTGVIATDLDMPKGTVGTTLKRMETKGIVHQPREGVWALTPVAASAAA